MTIGEKRKYYLVSHTLRMSFMISMLFFISTVSCVLADDGLLSIGRKNGRLALECGSREKGYPLMRLYDTSSRINFIQPDLPLWSAELEHESGKMVTLSSSDCDACTVETLSPFEAVLKWSLDNTLEKTVSGSTGDSNQGITAVCYIKLEAEKACLKLRMYNHSQTWSIRQVTFPDLKLQQLGKSDSDDALVFPFAAGKVVRRPLAKVFGFGGEQNDPSTDRMGRYPNPWTNMQFCAYYDEKSGIYIAAEDPYASVKSLNCEHTGDLPYVLCKIDWPVENAGIAGNDFEHPGTVTLEIFNGDWFDAAKIYRKWLIGNAQWWPAMGPEGRFDTPDWMKNIAVWVLASLNPQAVEQTIQFAEFMGVPTALHLYNWHQVSFDNDYPHYFPVKDGFRESVKKLQEANIHVMPYINARLWDDDTGDFKTFALPAATKKENGDYYIEQYGSKQNLVPMCPTTDIWQNTVKSIVMQLVGPQFDVDGVYLDQVSAMSPVLCFDQSHGHPLGGGHWWTTDGYWPMMESLQSALAREYPDKMLTSECNAEPYIRGFDGYLTWHFQFNDMVPLFSAVYGGTIQQFGRAFSGNDGAAHRMKIGQSLVFGEQLGWINPSIIESDIKTAEYLRRAARMRYEFIPFLSWGEMMRPPEVQGNIPEITAEWAWAREEKMVTDSSVQSGAWKSPDGRIVFIFANASDDEIIFEWCFDPDIYGFKGKPLQLEAVNSGEEIRTVRKSVNKTVNLSSCEIKAYIVSPD
ncbi:MAG: hypothetical protein JXB48_02735 [Candidatus Latescibacteria bacterium]|nr:hypothetical protein [Candidatus Latescibacterota bacterium]